MALLGAVVPAGAYVADFLFAAASDAGGIDDQLRLVAETSVLLNRPSGLLEPCAATSCTHGSEGAAAQQCAAATRLHASVAVGISGELDPFQDLRSG